MKTFLVIMSIILSSNFSILAQSKSKEYLKCKFSREFTVIDSKAFIHTAIKDTAIDNGKLYNLAKQFFLKNHKVYSSELVSENLPNMEWRNENGGDGNYKLVYLVSVS